MNTLIKKKPVVYAHVRASVAYTNISGSPKNEDMRSVHSKMRRKVA